jgi:hypothetical protein
MKRYFEALMVYMRNLGVEKIWTEMAMDGRSVDNWDEEFQAVINGQYKLISMPKQFIKLFDVLVEKYADEINDESQSDYGSEYYRVNINVHLAEREMVITSEIEEEETKGDSDEYDVIDNPSVQSFLDENNIDYLMVDYSGGGDDGSIEDDGYDDDGNRFRISNNLEDFLYSRLNSSFGGWEINEGSSGKFIIQRETVEIEHEWYETEWVNSELNIVITEKDLD